MIAHDQLIKWVSRLVQIPSVTPAQAGPRAGKSGEAQIATAIAGWFADFGAQLTVEEIQPGRPNVYGVWAGAGDRWLAIDVHTDTVGVEQMTRPPFDGAVENGRVYGRGAVDTKASLGVILALLEEMSRSGRAPSANLVIGATVDEEVGSSGAPAFADWLVAQRIPVSEMIVAEPTDCAPVHGHKGVVRITFDVHGKAAHSSQPEQGENAIAGAAYLMLALEEERMHVAQNRVSPIGVPRLTITLVHGGTGINVVPDSCAVSLDRRIVSTEKAHEVASALVRLANEACPLPITVDVQKEIDAFYQAPDTPFVQQLAALSKRQPVVAPYGTNAWAYQRVGCERVVLGPGSIDQAHGAVEWVSVSELVNLSKIYTAWWGID